MGRHAELVDIELPEFGLPRVEPVIPAETYRKRIDETRSRARGAGYDVLVVYGDREHFANMAYLTGYDPRFEESLLVIDVDGPRNKGPVLIVGHEGLGYVEISPVRCDIETILYPGFSLMGQDRSRCRELREALMAVGVERGSRVGVAGWKYFTFLEARAPETWLETPSYIADVLRTICGGREYVRNANGIFMDPGCGVRTVNDVDQLASFEYAAAHSSQAVKNALFGLRPGMSEFDAVELMRLKGLPFSCHLMLSTGPRAFMGLPSPSSRRMERGDPFTTACGFWGALTCRAGFLVEDAEELPKGISDYVDRLVAPYFEAIASWYKHIGIGVSGGELYRAIHDRIGDPFFGVSLNPGHIIHLDEWVHSPFYEGSTIPLRSGMALQVDVIPATHSPYFTTNIEDGIALADKDLRKRFEDSYPEAWERVQARRAFMEDDLGIRVKPEVMPFSNISSYLPPFLLSPNMAMRMVSTF